MFSVEEQKGVLLSFQVIGDYSDSDADHKFSAPVFVGCQELIHGFVHSGQLLYHRVCLKSEEAPCAILLLFMV